MADFLLNYKYLTTKSLEGFDKYKYKSVDTSPLSQYVMHPFWNRLVKVLPLWVPANLLTLVGWLLSLLVFAVFSWYDPHLKFAVSANRENMPAWIWLGAAICTFLAHQLDGIDGKQARRTNSSSPLGELFDHGLDSSAVWLMALSHATVFGVSQITVLPWELVFMLYFTLFAFYIAHWEKYTTATLYLPWAYDFSQIWLTSAYFVTFLFGLDMWKVTFLGGALNIPRIFKITLYGVVLFVCLPVSISNQRKARKENPTQCVSVEESIQPLISLGSITALHVLYGYLAVDNVVETQLKLYVVSYGILYANVNCRLIVAQMSGGLCERFNMLAYPLVPMIILSRLRIASDLTLLLGYVIFLTLAHLHYGVNVVRQLCEHLNVYCFRVGKPPEKKGVQFETNGTCNYSHKAKQ